MADDLIMQIRTHAECAPLFMDMHACAPGLSSGRQACLPAHSLSSGRQAGTDHRLYVGSRVANKAVRQADLVSVRMVFSTIRSSRRDSTVLRGEVAFKPWCGSSGCVILHQTLRKGNLDFLCARSVFSESPAFRRALRAERRFCHRALQVAPMEPGPCRSRVL